MRLTERESPRKAAVGAALPDAPAILGAAWLFTKRWVFSRSDFEDEVCGRSLFRTPDSALHSALPIAAALAMERILRSKNSAFTLGWLGHVVADFLTHGKDARPALWPISEKRFHSPISYREKERHGRLFTAVEHAATLLILLKAWRFAAR